MITVIFILIALLGIGCAPADRHFWYPIELSQATCINFTGEVYWMTNSIGWSSAPYILEKSVKKRITLGMDCVFRTIRKLPKHEWPRVQDKLTDEQRAYLVEGFR